MNKLLAVSIIMCGLFLALSIDRYSHVSVLKNEELLLNNKIEEVNKKIQVVEKYQSAKLPDLTVSLWNLNAYLRLYGNQFNKQVDLKKEEDGRLEAVIKGSINYYPLSIRFNQLKSVDDHLRVLKLLDKIKQNLPLRILSLEGFNNYVMIHMVLVADQGGVK